MLRLHTANRVRLPVVIFALPISYKSAYRMIAEGRMRGQESSHEQSTYSIASPIANVRRHGPRQVDGRSLA